EDLLFKPAFVTENLRMLRSLIPASAGILVVVGYVDRDAQGRLYNTAAVLFQKKQLAAYRKVELPNYGVFDEKRYFTSGADGLIIEAFGLKIGFSICEDIWLPESFVTRPPYKGGLSWLVNLSASPYHRDKQRSRVKLDKRLAQRTGATILYNNLVGGQDELVFDGGSLVVSPKGKIMAEAALFQEELLFADLPLKGGSSAKKARLPRKLRAEAEVYEALVMGTRDYIQKNRFKKVLVGLS